jgi:ankyrin repeat protein
MYNPFFLAAIKGDLRTLRDFFKNFALEELLSVVDSSKKSPLHHSAREGQLSVTDYLITRGYLVNAREKTLKTPLHYACLFGHSIVADMLLRNGADIMAKDISGRTCFHFACSSWSSETIALLLGLKPELINDKDRKERVGLHYAVWNNSENQVDILRTLIERGGNINAFDGDGKTALHHAAEGARLRAIPILIQRGIDMGKREFNTNKTALELARNARTRELMVVYSSVPYINSESDINYLNNAVKGDKVSIKKENVYSGERLKVNPKTVGTGTGLSAPSTQTLVPEFIREAFMQIMKKLQEMGIKSGQQYKRPYLFTGSWLEGVTTIEQLFARVKDLTPQEVAIRVFNILKPYDQPWPREQGDEVTASKFYGEYYQFDVDKNKDGDLKDSLISRAAMSNIEISKLNATVDMYGEKVKQLQDEKLGLLSEVDDYKSQVYQLSNKFSDYDTLKQSSLIFQQQINKLNLDNLEKEKKMGLIERSKLNESKVTEGHLNTLIDENKKLTGTIRGLENELSSSTSKFNQLKSEIDARPPRQERETTAGQPRNQEGRLMTPPERTKFTNKPIKALEQKILESLALAVAKTTPKTTLTSELKKNNDSQETINEYSFNKTLQNLGIDGQDLNYLTTFFEFSKRLDFIYIEDIQTLYDRSQKVTQKNLHELLANFCNSLMARGDSVEEAFNIFDTDQSAE